MKSVKSSLFSSAKIAANYVNQKGLLAFPTDTLYGIGTLMSNIDGINKIYNLKQRDKSKLLTVYVSSLYEIEELIGYKLSSEYYRLAKCFLPGPLTLIIPTLKKYNLFGTTIAFRIVNHSLFKELLYNIKEPLVATSANRSNMPSAVNAKDVFLDFPDADIGILDGGICPIGIESTLVSIAPLKILREGYIPYSSIEAVLNERALEILKEKKWPHITITLFYSYEKYLLYKSGHNNVISYDLFQPKLFYSILREAYRKGYDEIIGYITNQIVNDQCHYLRFLSENTQVCIL